MAEQDAWIAAPTGPAEFHDCIGFVDATYIRVERPKVYSLERRLYSTYKKYHAVFFVAIVDRLGLPQHIRVSSKQADSTCSSLSVCVPARVC